MNTRKKKQSGFISLRGQYSFYNNWPRGIQALGHCSQVDPYSKVTAKTGFTVLLTHFGAKIRLYYSVIVLCFVVRYFMCGSLKSV